ncbi:MAG: MBL fold metallo-hydrolase [Bacillota bacterium]
MQITERVHALKVPFKIPVGPGIAVDRFVYVFIIYSESICLVDTGVNGSEEVVFDYIRKTGRMPEEISLVVLTHAHPDHIGALAAVKQATGCTVAAHAGDRRWVEDVELQLRERPIPGFKTLVGGSVKVDAVLEDGDVLELGGRLALEVFHTPGHSNGSISFFLKEGGVLFSGDAIPIAGDIPIYDDVQESVDSINKLKGIGGVNLLLSSWDEPREGERAYRAMDDGLRCIQCVHEAVLKAAGGDSPQDPVELCRRVVAEMGLPPAAANPLAARSFAAHLKVCDRADLLRE